VGRRARTVPRT